MTTSKNFCRLLIFRSVFLVKSGIIYIKILIIYDNVTKVYILLSRNIISEKFSKLTDVLFANLLIYIIATAFRNHQISKNLQFNIRE